MVISLQKCLVLAKFQLTNNLYFIFIKMHFCHRFVEGFEVEVIAHSAALSRLMKKEYPISSGPTHASQASSIWLPGIRLEQHLRMRLRSWPAISNNMARAQGKLSINPWGELVENARAAASAASEAICICLAWPNGLDSRGLGRSLLIAIAACQMPGDSEQNTWR